MTLLDGSVTFSTEFGLDYGQRRSHFPTGADHCGSSAEERTGEARDGTDGGFHHA